MKLIKLKVAFIGVAVLLLVGCTAIKKLDKSGEYKKSSPCDKPLVLPGDLNKGAIKNRYPVPKVEDGKHHSHDISTAPPVCKL